jgi:hypothetical protein
MAITERQRTDHPEPRAGAGPAPQAWEVAYYFIGSIRTQEDVLAISALGADGWELTAVDQGHMYFKRPV